MYLYIAENETGKLTPVALLPTTRGRPAKNHTRVDIHGYEFNVFRSRAPEMLTIKSAEELKAVASAGIIKPEDEEENLATPEEYLQQLLVAVCGGLAALDKTFVASLDPNTRKQLPVVEAALNNELRKLPTQDADAKVVATILEANARMLNRLLAENPTVGWYHIAKAHFAASVKAETPTEEKIDVVETKEGTEVEMSTATINFGFGKLTGEERPKLRVTEDAAEADRAAGVFCPKPDETYIINAQVAQLFKILQISRKNCPQNVNLVGPHGCGKTELAIQFAARLNLPLLIMDCANLREARDWFGYKSAKDGTVFWHESQFVRAVEAGNHVILLDELNRANPHLLNTLMPLLDARRFTYLEEKGDKICVGPGTVFFASMNEGAGYTGTSALDRAIRDRFPRVVELTYLEEEDEIKLLVNRVGVNQEIATRLVGMANKIRQDATGLSAALTESMSTRQLIAAAHDFAIGGVETLTFTISNHFSAEGDDDSERVRVQNIIQGKFGDLLAATAAKKGA